jgi:hypothetical protein
MMLHVPKGWNGKERKAGKNLSLPDGSNTRPWDDPVGAKRLDRSLGAIPPELRTQREKERETAGREELCREKAWSKHGITPGSKDPIWGDESENGSWGLL